jgi:hypothetical protein
MAINIFTAAVYTIYGRSYVSFTALITLMLSMQSALEYLCQLSAVAFSYIRQALLLVLLTSYSYRSLS